MGKKTEKGSGAPRSTHTASSSHPDSPGQAHTAPSPCPPSISRTVPRLSNSKTKR